MSRYAAQTNTQAACARIRPRSFFLAAKFARDGAVRAALRRLRRTRMRARARSSAPSYTERAFGKDCSIATAQRIAGLCRGQVPPCGPSPRVIGVGTRSTRSALGVLGVCRG